jgi:hypothetical protein
MGVGVSEVAAVCNCPREEEEEAGGRFVRRFTDDLILIL